MNLGIMLPGKTSEMAKGGRERNTKMRGNGSGVQSTSISDASALNVAAIHERPTRKHPGPRLLSVNSLKPQKQTQSEPTAGQVEPKCPSKEVPGVRRVWGTMRNCSNRTVLIVLQRLSTVSEKVEIRRKFNISCCLSLFPMLFFTSTLKL